jgi:CPA2 family monovalent cation:H+ antiporter-2
MAMLAQVLEISFALGAFIAGLIVSGSEAASDVLNEIVPIRDVFASLFFVSIGMLIDPVFLWNNIFSVLLIVVTVIVGKWLIVGGLLAFFKQPLKSAALAGLLLAQVGEFSFVLAGIGVDSKAIDQTLEKLLLSSALLTIIASPLLLQAFPTFVMWATFMRDKIAGPKKVEIIGAGTALPISMNPIPKAKDSLEAWNQDSLMLKIERELRSQTERWPFKKHVIVCGYGRVGRELVDACQRRNFEVVLIELDQRRVEAARIKGVLTFYGDSSVEATLKQANVEQAKVLAITVPDLIVAEATTRLAHLLNPNLEIITRATETRAVQLLKQVGANEVVQPEFEAGVEFIRRTARLYGVGGVELQGLVNGWRSRYYGQKEA